MTDNTNPLSRRFNYDAVGPYNSNESQLAPLDNAYNLSEQMNDFSRNHAVVQPDYPTDYMNQSISRDTEDRINNSVDSIFRDRYEDPNINSYDPNTTMYNTYTNPYSNPSVYPSQTGVPQDMAYKTDSIDINQTTQSKSRVSTLFKIVVALLIIGLLLCLGYWVYTKYFQNKSSSSSSKIHKTSTMPQVPGMSSYVQSNNMGRVSSQKVMYDSMGLWY